MKPAFSILFVCMGNICRSPTAEGVMQAKLQAAGLHDRIHIDSAGTHAYHAGHPPDKRSQAAARQRGYDLSTQRARQVKPQDFAQFDFILAMDSDNLSLLKDSCPPAYRPRLKRLMSFAPHLKAQDVPDPYYGSGEGFETVLDYIEAACDGLLHQLQQKLSVGQGPTL